VEPVGVGKYRKGNGNEQDQHDEAAATPTARTAAANTKTPLQPSERPIEQEEFEQASQTSLAIAHDSLLEVKF
jgi:hypothetical protein